jgi:hypothetical protein
MKGFLFCVCLILSGSFAHSQVQGFFLNDNTDKEAAIPQFKDVAKATGNADANVTIKFNNEVAPISKYLFGNNANIFMTQMVDQPVLINHIKKLSPNVLRFPGGNLSSIFFWDAMKGQPPADAPVKLLDGEGKQIDPGYWYGKNTESWTMSLDNYYAMLQQTNSTGIITVNYGYARYGTSADPVAAAAHLAAQWVRYDNGRTKFWEIGNESNGSWQAGFRIDLSSNKDSQPQIITGDLYGKHFKVFADSMRKAAAEIQFTIYIGAQLLEKLPESWWNATDKGWNSGVFSMTADLPDYYIVHSYFTPYTENTNASNILTSGTKVPADIMSYVKGAQQSAGVSSKPIALTEWNIFAEGSKQTVSYISGMHATLVLQSLIKNKYGMASRWDLANSWEGGKDMGMFNQGDEPGGIPKWNPRPSFYYMYYFQKYTGDTMVESTVSGDANIEVLATKFSSGEAGIVLVNKNTTAKTASINLSDFGFGERYYRYTLTGGSDNGEFSLKVYVNDEAPDFSSGGPLDYETIKAQSSLISTGIKTTLPPRSVQYLLVETGNNVIMGIDQEKQDNIAIYPSLVTDQLTVEFPNSLYNRVQLLDAMGNLLLTESIHQQETSKVIRFSFSSGIYLVRLSGVAGVVVRKISAK